MTRPPNPPDPQRRQSPSSHTWQAFTPHQLGRAYVLALSKSVTAHTDGDDKKARQEENNAERILWVLCNQKDTKSLHDFITGIASETKRQIHRLHRDTTTHTPHPPHEQEPAMSDPAAPNNLQLLTDDHAPDSNQVAPAIQRIEDATNEVDLAIFDLGILYFDQIETIATSDDSTPANDNAHDNVETIERYLKTLNADQLRWYIKGLHYPLHRRLM